MKNQIIEKTTWLLKTYGIKGNTMDDIAHEAGISKKTLYQYVADKEALIRLVIENEKLNIQTTIDQIIKTSNDNIEELIRINVSILKFLQSINPASINDLRKHYKSIYDQYKQSFQNMFSGIIKNNLILGKENKVYRNDLNEELITQLHTDRINQIQEADSLWGQNAKSTETIKEMTNYYIRGLITEKGEQILNKHIVEFNKYLNE